MHTTEAAVAAVASLAIAVLPQANNHFEISINPHANAHLKRALER